MNGLQLLPSVDRLPVQMHRLRAARLRSDRAIAEATGLSAATVAGIRLRSTVQSEQLNARVGRDRRGRVRSAGGTGRGGGPRTEGAA
jgi:hypothetical protein